MLKKVETLLIVIIVIVAGQLAYFFLRPKKNTVTTLPQPPPPSVDEKTHPYNFSGPCPGNTESRKMSDSSMKGILEENADYKVVLNFYWCNNAKKGDLILLQWSQGQEPVVRKVYAVEGDHFAVLFDKKNKNWNLKINDKMVMENDAVFGFGAEPPPPLKLLETSRKGILGKRELIVLSSPFGTHDSVLLGLVNLNDVVGKVERP